VTRDEAERAYEKAIVVRRAAYTREIMALRMMRAGEITVAVHDRARADRRAATARLSAARRRLRYYTEQGRDPAGA
jgi:hypothetical protein